MSIDITMSVWTSTPDEAVHIATLEQRLAIATTPKTRNEVQRLINEYWSEMQRRHRDDPPRVPTDPAAEAAVWARQRDDLERRLREPSDDDPPRPPEETAPWN